MSDWDENLFENEWDKNLFDDGWDLAGASLPGLTEARLIGTVFGQVTDDLVRGFRNS